MFYLSEQASDAPVLPRTKRSERKLSSDGCSTSCEQAGMRVLPLVNKQGCVFYPL
ncbi:MAG: hypothetical protein ACPGWR_08560 [Ardenticatenaceae bacterium]